jgi:hypothetical protein
VDLMTDPFSQFFEEAGRKLEQLERDTVPVEPRARVIPGDGDVMARILDAYRLAESAPPMRTEPIKLTEQQLDTIRAQQPERSPLELGVVAPLFGVPIEKVDTVEESTPYLEGPRYATGGPVSAEQRVSFLAEAAHVPGGILRIPIQLTDEEYQRFERRWRKKYGGTRNAHRVKLLGRHPWSWWKRAYYRARRWLA